METLIAPFLNVLALLAVLGFYLRKPLAVYVAQRHETITAELGDARVALSRATQQVAELKQKLLGMTEELASLKVQARQEAKASSEAILASAQSLSRSILSDAQAAAVQTKAEFKKALRMDLASLAITRAEVRLRDRLTGEDHARIRREFSTLVEKSQ
ncbi:MAG: hypothetical protein RJB38_167 [Pseudomonadota bacterium]